MKKTQLNQCVAILFCALVAGTATSAMAAPLEEVSLQQQGSATLATISMSTPIRFLRAAPSGKARTVEIFYERVPGSTATETWTDQEVRSTAATAATPAFTVTTRDQATQPKLVVEFAREVDFSITPGADGRSFVIVLKPEAVAAPAAKLVLPLLPEVNPPKLDPALENAASNEVNQQAYGLMQSGRDALAAKNYPLATETFNKLLMLPPNQYSQDGQEWVGVARERAGQTAKAKAEYELYLKVFANSPNVPAVRQRLAGLTAPTTVAPIVAPVKKVEPRSFMQGGIGTRYYFGQSTLTTTYPFNGVNQTDTITLKDQSSLMTNLDATARYLNEDYDTRLVFRDVLTQNFLPKGVNRNRLNSAYVDIKNRKAEFSARLGRQSSSGGGVMGRFDGALAGYGSAQDFRVNAVAGQLAEFSSTPAPVFYGLSVDQGMMSYYLINQTIEGLQDRRGVGAEFKYFATGQMAYAAVDYDIYFGMLNTATANGSLTFDTTGTTLNLMADYRSNVSTRNALNGALTTSIATLQTALTNTQIKQLAMDRTIKSSTSQVGITQKLSKNWQLGADLRLSSVGAYAASGDATLVGLQGYLPDYAGSGIEKTLTGQLIGSNLYSENDMTSIGTSLTSSATVQGAQSLFIYNRTAFDADLYLDSSWNYYRQSDNYGGNIVRNMPMIRVAYQLGQSLSLDMDTGVELTESTGTNQSTKNTRLFGSFGFRWDF